jgi:hypothetical protein
MDNVTICDQCFALVDGFKWTEHRAIRMNEVLSDRFDWCSDVVTTPSRRSMAERIAPTPSESCEVCDGHGLPMSSEDDMSDDDWVAMFGFDDPLDHYGE